MFNWFQRTIQSGGIVFFPGTEVLRPENFRLLAGIPIEARSLTPEPGNAWALELYHAEWGKATVVCPTELLVSPDQAVRYSSFVTDKEKMEARLARRGLLSSSDGRDRCHFPGHHVGAPLDQIDLNG